ncbi:MAG: DUF2130 domain-containing protein [Candidatus Moeniiplasma glomeromycotorum]|nr:DUF2130 domain-containing protein [Candidatus Moeniiplasma glomeromycotorum]MCE8168008.1 DUF2130 domain-containing protein [Candidatus Moeniiplasma glomeromycotorum]MCE8169676.1 DUF2130 domain-containing protein [Candidatus Moeniiplasma glomeromycotorum]
MINFSFPCPHCQKIITSQDFAENHFLISHLQSFFTEKENEYKQKLLQELIQNPANFPAYEQIKEENNQLKLILEGYKLGTNKGSKEKGEELEKYVTEKLQEAYNGADDISKITHVGTKADILQIIHNEIGKPVGKIIYEVKNEAKWDNKWLEKLEKDMVGEQADFGILVATCRKGNPIWKPTPQQNILVSDDDSFIFASQMARLLIFSRLRANLEERPEERVKKLEEWVKEKLPNYLLKLEKHFTEWEKDIGRINTSVKSMEKNREEMRKVVMGEIELELKLI